MGKHLGTQKSIRFDADELELLEAAKKRHGSYKAAIVAGLRKDVGSNEMSVDDVVSWLQRNVKIELK